NGYAYCCGFTFWVGFTCAKQLGLLPQLSGKALSSAQKQWYGAVDAGNPAYNQQVAAALPSLQLGRPLRGHLATPRSTTTPFPPAVPPASSPWRATSSGSGGAAEAGTA